MIVILPATALGAWALKNTGLNSEDSLICLDFIRFNYDGM